MQSVKTKGKLWLHSGDKASWVFLTLDDQAAKKMNEAKESRKKRTGWGQVSVTVKLGKSNWKTSVFPDKKRGWILPVKADVRKKNNISEGDIVIATLSWI